MPHYDYECSNCGQVFEVFQQISAAPLTQCPKCKGSVRRLIGSGCGLIFKGSGFYITDYKRNNQKNSSSEKDNKKNSSDSSKKKSEVSKTKHTPKSTDN